MLKENTHKEFSLVLGQYTKLLKIKLKESKGWIQASAKIYFIELVNTIRFITFKL